MTEPTRRAASKRDGTSTGQSSPPHGGRTDRRGPLRIAMVTMALVAGGCADGPLAPDGPDAPMASAGRGYTTVSGGWSVGDAVPDLSALDVDGVEISLGEYAGEFVLLEVGGAWCSPTQFVAPFLPNVEQVISDDGVPFTALVSLVDGTFPGNPSDQTLVRAWLDNFYGGAYRPVLHMDGSSAAAEPWTEPIAQYGAIPLLFLLGPDGRIVNMSLGALGEAGLIAWVRDGISKYSAPRIESVNGPEGPVSNATPVVIEGTYFDPEGDTRAGTVDWGDGSGPQALQVDGAGTFVTPGHTYASGGFFDVVIELMDDEGHTTSETLPDLTIFDPDGGFIAGAGSVRASGWFCADLECEEEDSPTPTMARFRLLARYAKKAVVPDGALNFRFESGSFAFESTRYDWLIVNQNGRNAQLKGEGLVNDQTPEDWGLPPGGVFRFMLRATDGSPDSFELSVWLDHPDTGEFIVYAEPQALALETGNIILTRGR